MTPRGASRAVARRNSPAAEPRRRGIPSPRQTRRRGLVPVVAAAKFAYAADGCTGGPSGHVPHVTAAAAARMPVRLRLQRARFSRPREPPASSRQGPRRHVGQCSQRRPAHGPANRLTPLGSPGPYGSGSRWLLRWRTSARSSRGPPTARRPDWVLRPAVRRGALRPGAGHA